jgi:hypothetical protein
VGFNVLFVFLIAVRTDYWREVFGGGEGGTITRKTSSYFTALVGLTISRGSKIAAASGSTYTPAPAIKGLCSWQQDMEQAAIPAPGECAHSIGASRFAASLFVGDGEFALPCPCAAHMFPAQHDIPRAAHADAHIGADSSTTAVRHTHAATILRRASGVWSECFIETR